MVTKKELGQLCDLRKEIKELESEIENLQDQKRVVRDKVQKSMDNFPYIQGRTTVYSTDPRADRVRRQKITDKELLLLQRRQQAADAEVLISEYIKTVTDSRIRRIIFLKYEKCMTWEEVADEMNYDRTYPEKMLTRYLKEHK